MKAVRVAAEIAAAAKALSRHRCGALITWDPASKIAGGIVLDARVSHQLLVAIHGPDPVNQLRTGITVVRGPRIERVAVPMDWDDIVEHADELAPGVSIAIEDSGEIRWLDRTGQVETADINTLARVLHRRALML